MCGTQKNWEKRGEFSAASGYTRLLVWIFPRQPEGSGFCLNLKSICYSKLIFANSFLSFVLMSLGFRVFFKPCVLPIHIVQIKSLAKNSAKKYYSLLWLTFGLSPLGKWCVLAGEGGRPWHALCCQSGRSGSQRPTRSPWTRQPSDQHPSSSGLRPTD